MELRGLAAARLPNCAVATNASSERMDGRLKAVQSNIDTALHEVKGQNDLRNGSSCAGS